MKRDRDAIGLLVLWWRCEQSGALRVLGYPAECPSTRGWMASKQHDDLNGAQETDERGELAKAVGGIVNSLQEPHRTALYIVARNNATGAAVFSSPRLPEGEQLQAVIADALAMFQERL